MKLPGYIYQILNPNPNPNCILHIGGRSARNYMRISWYITLCMGNKCVLFRKKETSLR
jgi:hypothetical protein